VRAALRRLRGAVRIVGLSTFYRTAPLNRPEQAPFVNGVIAVETDLPPHALKYTLLRQIEAELGRCRTADKYAPRTIDLDLLAYDALVLTGEDLVLPDPEIVQRAFLAVPFCELAPDYVLPDSGRRLREVADTFCASSMTPLTAFTEQLRKDNVDGLSES